MIRRILVIVLLCFGTAAAQNSIGLSVRTQSNQILVDVNLTNTDTVSGMQIPLDLPWGRLGLRLDSVSFAGTRCGGFFELTSRVIPEQEKVFLWLIESADPTLDSHPVMPGSGRIATIYLFRISQPQISSWRITNERVRDDLRDLRFLVWTNRAEEVACAFDGVTINMGR